MNIKNLYNAQLALPLKFRELKNRSNFIINDGNELAIKLVDELSDLHKFKKKYNFPCLYIYGDKGSGKSHLASIFAERHEAIIINNLDRTHFDIAEKGRSFVFENFDGNQSKNEEMLMHFFNEALFSSYSILILSKFSPKQINFSLPDLKSRIQSFMNVKITLPNDESLFCFLVKELYEKRIELSDNDCLYVIKRIRRNYASIIEFVNQLDRFLLEIKRKVKMYEIKRIINYVNFLP